jgi:hypothetical protein
MPGERLPSLFGVDAPVILKKEKTAGFSLRPWPWRFSFCQPGKGGAN